MICVTNHKKFYYNLNMHFPKVSVIVPIYKAELYIRRCIDSILLQTYKDFELILVDDGSPDKSGEICEEYAIKDTRVRVFHKINGGVSSARNLALDNAIGDFIMFVDSDDWIASDCLELCIKEILDKELDALQFGFVMVWDDRKYYRIKNGTGILSGDHYIQTKSFNVSAWGGVYKRNIIEEYNLRFHSQLKLAEDQIFILSLLRYVKRIKYLDKSLYYYFQRADSAVHTSKSMDMLLSCEKLIDLSKEWPSSKSFIDKMIVDFIIGMIKNNDVSHEILKGIYKSQNVGNFYAGYKLQTIFKKIAQINFNLACRLTSKYFQKKK